MPLHRFFILLLLFNVASTYASSTPHEDISVIDATKELAGELHNKDVVRILAIGNSFSEDAIENYLYDLAQAENIEVIIGNLYIGGAPLDLHWHNAKENIPAYDYRKIDRCGHKTNTQKRPLPMHWPTKSGTISAFSK